MESTQMEADAQLILEPVCALKFKHGIEMDERHSFFRFQIFLAPPNPLHGIFNMTPYFRALLHTPAEVNRSELLSKY